LLKRERKSPIEEAGKIISRDSLLVLSTRLEENATVWTTGVVRGKNLKMRKWKVFIVVSDGAREDPSFLQCESEASRLSLILVHERLNPI
jgi:hypothetical protein